MSFNIIYSTLPLNKDICNIIFKYTNLTSDILRNLAFKNRDKANEYFNEESYKLSDIILQNLHTTTLIDIISLIIPLGWTGFVLQIKDVSAIEIINKDPDILNGLLASNYCYKNKTITINIKYNSSGFIYSKIGYLYNIITLHKLDF